MKDLPTTLGAALLAVAERPDVVVRFWRSADDAPVHTYGELAEGALEVAGALREDGLKPGDRVAIVLSTHPDFYRAFFGVSLAGGVPTALYPPVRLGRIDEWKVRTADMLRSIDAAAVITERRLVGLLGGPVKQATPRLGCRTVPGLRRRKLVGSPVDAVPEALATIQFSSGSTGKPKPVALSHQNMITNSRVIMTASPGHLEDQSGVSWLPLYHDMGLVGSLLTAVISQRDLTLIGPERFVTRPRIWLEALTATRATVSVAPNFAFGLCTAKIPEDQLEGLDLSNWHLALCGAEPVHPDTMEAFAERFAPTGFDKRALTPVYGLAEVTLAATFTSTAAEPNLRTFDGDTLDQQRKAVPDDAGTRRLVALGQPLPGIEIAIRDETGSDLPEGRVGTIWVKGHGVMLGYFDQPEKTAEVLVDGWLDTGDTGFIHDDDLFLCGRIKDLIIIRGRNHDPSHIEQACDGVDGLRTGCAAAFGVGDPRIGTERLVLLVESASAQNVDRGALASEAAKAVIRQTNLNPDEVVIIAPGTLPRTSSGKIRRGEARRRWLADKLTAPGSAGAGVMLRESVVGLAHQLAALRGRRRP